MGLLPSPSAPASAATQSASGKRPATPFRPRCTRTSVAWSTILEGEGARFTGDGVSTLSGDSPLSNRSGTSRHQLRTIARVYISVWIWLLGSVTPAYHTRGMNRPNLRGFAASSLLKKVFEVSLWATLIQDPSARRTKDSQP